MTSLLRWSLSFLLILPFLSNFGQDCPGPPNSGSYCYANDEIAYLYFASNDPGNDNVFIEFTSGFVEVGFDVLSVYDGYGPFNPILFSGDGDLTGLTVESTGNFLTIEIITDYSVSCQDGYLPGPIEYDYWCSEPVAPAECSYPPFNFTHCYGDNANDVFTFISDTPGIPITAVFNSGTFEADFDAFTIFDGPDDSSPIIYFTDNSVEGQVIQASGDYLTFEVLSDPSINCSDGTWGLEEMNVDIYCGSPTFSLGCTDFNACNFNFFANVDDGSCTYPGCDEPWAPNYDPAAGCDDGSCEEVTCDFGNGTQDYSGLPTGIYGPQSILEYNIEFSNDLVLRTAEEFTHPDLPGTSTDFILTVNFVFGLPQGVIMGGPTVYFPGSTACLFLSGTPQEGGYFDAGLICTVEATILDAVYIIEDVILPHEIIVPENNIDCNAIGNEGWSELDSGIYPYQTIAVHNQFYDGELVFNVPEANQINFFEAVTVAINPESATGLPAGMSIDPLPQFILNGEQACLLLTGTPTECGTFEVTVLCTVEILNTDFIELIENVPFTHTIIIAPNGDYIAGCTYEYAPNYNPGSTLDDGSCAPPDYSLACGEGTVWDEASQSCIAVDNCPEDINGDGVVSTTDLLQFLGAFGSICEPLVNVNQIEEQAPTVLFPNLE